jgi:hypothetical protein
MNQTRSTQIMMIIYAAKYEGVPLDEATKDILSLFDNSESEKTSILDWPQLYYCGGRLRNNIFNLTDGKGGFIKYIEDIGRNDFKRKPELGKKSWQEFQLLRGY